MKLFIKVMTVIAVLCAPQLVIADLALSKDSQNTVIISADVQEQIQKLNPSERKKVEAAIRTGNQFIPHHFDGTAYAINDKQELKLWARSIRPLVNKGADDWHAEYVGNEPKLYLEIDGQKADLIAVCPQTELFLFNYSETKTELMYRSEIIGMWKTEGTISPKSDILIDKNRNFQEVLVSVASNNKISYTAPKFAGLAATTKWVIDMYSSYIRHPVRAFVDSPEGVIMEPQSSIDEKKLRYKKLISLIQEEEAEACKKIMPKFNQPVVEKE